MSTFFRGSAFVIAFSLAACATPAQTFQYDNTRAVAADFDETWSRVISVLASNNLPIKTLEKVSGIIVAENEFVSMSSMGESASCPAPALATPISGVMNYNVFVKSVSATSTTVTVNTAYRMGYSGYGNVLTTEVCNSNGNVERKLLNAISGELRSRTVASETSSESRDIAEQLVENAAR